MEAAQIPWRPLGELFVDRGLISEDELETALAEQAATGKRLGEILVDRGLVSGPDLTSTLMDQLGVEVAKEDGYGSGLWAEIKRRHRRARLDGDDEGVEDDDADEPQISLVPAPEETWIDVEPELEPAAELQPRPEAWTASAPEVAPELEEELEEIKAEYIAPAVSEPEPAFEPGPIAVFEPKPEPTAAPEPEIEPVAEFYALPGPAFEPEPVQPYEPEPFVEEPAEQEPAEKADEAAALRAELEEARTDLARLQEMLADAMTALAAFGEVAAREQHAE